MAREFILNYINFYPPFLGAGIRVKYMSEDYTHIEVEMKLRFWNKNYVSTQFGGSLYMMTDPFFMLILMKNLGKDYIVWDKAANIHFQKPGRGRVHATFHLSKEQIAAVRESVDKEGKIEPVFTVEIKDDSNEVIATIDKTLYIRRKDAVKPNS
jgi:acyl-coenzyme A thioesterase PaaI-like protein